MNLFKKKRSSSKPSSRQSSRSSSPGIQTKRLSCNASVNYIRALDAPNYMAIIPYLSTIEDVMEFVQINKKCKGVLSKIKVNPYYCSIGDSLQTKQRIVQTELKLFPNIETLHCDLDVIKQLNVKSLRYLISYSIIGKIIYATPQLIQPIQSSITQISFYIDDNLTIPLNMMHYLQTIHVDINNNTEMLFFKKYFSTIIQSIQQLPCFQSIFIECNGDDLLKIQEYFTKFYSTRITVVFQIHHLNDIHIQNLQNLFSKKYIYFIVYEHDLSTISNLPLRFAFLNNHQLSLPFNLIFTPAVQKLCTTHYLPRLSLISSGLATSPPTTTIDLTEYTSLKSLHLSNMSFTKPLAISLPTTLTSLAISKSANFSLPNLLAVKLVEFVINECNSIKELYIPPTAKQVIVTHCSHITSLPNLCFIEIEALTCIECNNLTSIHVPSTTKEVVLYWCSKLKKLELNNGLELLDVFYTKQLTQLQLPSTLNQLDLNFCENLKKVEGLQALEHIMKVEMKQMFGLK
ncbi:Leucine-rich repeat containing protein [Entamoeba marina]